MNQPLFRDQFLVLWRRYFAGAELPLAMYFSSSPGDVPLARFTDASRCFVGDLILVRRGKPRAFTLNCVGCQGGKRYLGFTQNLRDYLPYFLSYGIEGELEGERYKKTPEIAQQAIESAPLFHAPAPYLICKRWDQLNDSDQPELAVFYATPDVLAGLFTLANYDQSETSAVIAPFCAGCGAIVLHPYKQRESENPKAILGMFDLSARPYIEENCLTLAMPIEKLHSMTANMEESFLITRTWKRMRRRIEKTSDFEG